MIKVGVSTTAAGDAPIGVREPMNQLDTPTRIDGAAEWEKLPPVIQGTIGAAAVEMVAAWIGLVLTRAPMARPMSSAVPSRLPIATATLS